MFSHDFFQPRMEDRDYYGCFLGFEYKFADSHFEESHCEVRGLVYPSFRKYVDPTVVWLIQEGDGMVHRRLIYSSGPERRISVNGKSVSEREE